VVGARPNFMKVAPIQRLMEKDRNTFDPVLVHTGQHYDERMSQFFFNDLGLPEPDVFLGVGSGSHAEQTAKIMIEFEKVCLKYKPDVVLVVGDVNYTGQIEIKKPESLQIGMKLVAKWQKVRTIDKKSVFGFVWSPP